MKNTYGRGATLMAAWVLLGSAGAAADTQVDERRAVNKDVRVSIESLVGTLDVTAWDKAEIAVTGTLGSGAEELRFTSHGSRARIEVESNRPFSRNARADLKIKVPHGATLDIECFACDTRVEGVRGSIQVQSVQGGVTIAGAESEVVVETVNGTIEVSGPTERLKLETVSGAVKVRDAGGEVQVATVSGRLAVDAGTLRRGAFQTVSGEIRVSGELESGADLEFETVSGGVELLLPKDVSARFDVSTFSGGIENDWGDGARRTSRWTPGKELTFSTGSGSARVRIQTMSGSVELRKQ